jgi:hypothetical protein
MRSAPKKGPSRCGGGGESMKDEDICSCTDALRDRHGRCSGESSSIQQNMAKIPLAYI